jgi:hypothetical protein
MEVEDIKKWWATLPQENLKEGCELKCPDCGEWASHKEWEECEVYCEDCGYEHAAMKCPNCEEAFDHVWSEPFECRVPFGGGDVQINNLS